MPTWHWFGVPISVTPTGGPLHIGALPFRPPPESRELPASQLQGCERMTQHALATLLFLLAATAPTPVRAASNEAPVQELRNRVDRAVQVMADPTVKGPSKLAERRARVR